MAQNNIEVAPPEKVYKENLFILVYAGTTTENVKGAVNTHIATYKLNELNIATNVYTPANYNPTYFLSSYCG